MQRKFIFILLGLLVLLLFQTQFYRFKTKVDIPDVVKERLHVLGQKALVNQDVPISAVILYNDRIIGEGYNTVYRDSNLSNHAEIIALNSVFKKYGNSFKNLDQDKLALYSTFEPCEMCKGAMIHYGIKNIYFEKNKALFSQIKSTLKTWYYHFNLQRFDALNLQEDLFEQHPKYLKP